MNQSEIHEKMNCSRCCEDGIELDTKTDASYATSQFQSDEEDIGGFASISGCLSKLKSSEKQVGTPKEEDLASWGHHFLPTSVPDNILQASAGDEVSFVFTNQVSGKLVPVESALRPIKEEASLKNQQKSKENISTFSFQTHSQNLLPSISSIGIQKRGIPMLPTPLKLRQKPLLKSPESVMQATLKNNLYPSNQTNLLPQKRFLPDDRNDDFE